VMQSAAPFVLAFVAERVSDKGALALVMLVGCLSLACFLMVRRPQPSSAGV